MKTLERQITKRTLLALAGKTIYERGERYFAQGAVTSLRMIMNTVAATVAGSSFDDYDIALKPGEKRLDYRCSCPMGEDWECCKHVVAAGLAWLEQGNALRDDTRLIQDYLLAQPQKTLAKWLLEQCVQDGSLHAALKQEATKAFKKPLHKKKRTANERECLEME